MKSLEQPLKCNVFINHGVRDAPRLFFINRCLHLNLLVNSTNKTHEISRSDYKNQERFLFHYTTLQGRLRKRICVDLDGEFIENFQQRKKVPVISLWDILTISRPVHIVQNFH